eukprot:1086604-Prorocentrum_minimum.AAC.5
MMPPLSTPFRLSPTQKHPSRMLCRPQLSDGTSSTSPSRGPAASNLPQTSVPSPPFPFGLLVVFAGLVVAAMREPRALEDLQLGPSPLKWVRPLIPLQ